MNYELAKKLKEAGFIPKNSMLAERAYDKNGGNYAYIPILSELINECLVPRGESDGRDSFFLERRVVEKDGMLDILWRSSLDMPWDDTDKEMGENSTGGYGLTPEEAVANLFLILQK